MRFTLFTAVAVFFSSVITATSHTRPYTTRGHALDLSSRASGGECAKPQPKTTKAPLSNVWEWTQADAISVLKFLFDQKELNLTSVAQAGTNSRANTIYNIELLQPNKTNVLPYLDSNGSAPVKNAHVVLAMGVPDNAYYQDIIVGPLPISKSTTWSPLEYPYTRKNQGKVRNPVPDANGLTNFSNGVAKSVKNITDQLWPDVQIQLGSIDPPNQENGHVVLWYGFSSVPTEEFDSSTILPLGLYFKADVTGRDHKKWKVMGWFYNGNFYESTAAFRSAFANSGFQRLGEAVDGSWAWTDRSGGELPMDKLPPPQSVAPGGSRYAVDVENRYVEWMDWSFYVSFTLDLGMALHDIRYKGQRILYELGLQEAVAHYAGQDPVQSLTTYLDSKYAIGSSAYELIEGYDCPDHASYFNTTYYAAEAHNTNINSICMFEYDAGYPMSRHASDGYTRASRNIFFTLRSVSTVGNYDYMFNYEFYMDGSIRVAARASGYIDGAYYANNEDYGYHIHDKLSGSMHDHVLQYKADFDILGTDNTMQLVTFVPSSEVYPWSGGQAINTMKVQRQFVENENDGRMNWSPNGATQYNVINKAKPNKYGELPGYRIQNERTSHLTVQNSTVLQAMAHWAENDIAVSLRKDTEPRSTHPFGGNDVGDPPIDFAKFFDGESLDQEDLVVWLNLGMHHLPHTGDLPNTVFTTAYSSVVFTPSNYFEGDVSQRTNGMVRIDFDGDDTTVSSNVTTFGQNVATCEVNIAAQQPDLTTYRSDISYQKYPFPQVRTSGLHSNHRQPGTSGSGQTSSNVTSTVSSRRGL